MRLKKNSVNRNDGSGHFPSMRMRFVISLWLLASCTAAPGGGSPTGGRGSVEAGAGGAGGSQSQGGATAAGASGVTGASGGGGSSRDAGADASGKVDGAAPDAAPDLAPRDDARPLLGELPRHLLIYLSPDGQLHDSWRPKTAANGTDLVQLVDTLAPLQPFVGRIIQLEWTPVAPLPKNDPAVATPHTFEGLVVLTAVAPPSWKGTLAGGASLDALIATAAGTTTVPRLGVFASGPGPCWTAEGTEVALAPGTPAADPDAAIEADFARITTAFTSGGAPVAVLSAGDPPAALVGSGSYHDLAHEAHDRRSEWVRATTWYATKLAQFLQSLDQKTRDDTVVLWLSDQYRPWHHMLEDQAQGDGLPVVIVANPAGPLKTGRFVRPRGYTHGDLLLTIGRLFGVRALAPGAITKATFAELLK